MDRNISGQLKDVENQLEQVAKGELCLTAQYQDIVEVQISLESLVFASWFDEYCAEVEDIVASRGGRLPLWSIADFRRYLYTILVSRVMYVRGERAELKFSDLFLVPTFFCVCLAQIGRAYNDLQGITLQPTVVIPEDVVLMSREEVLRFSTTLRTLERFGFISTLGYARDKHGDYDTMSFFVTEGFVLSYKESSPEAKAVVAAFLGVSGIQTVLSPRVCYGQVPHLAHLARQLAIPKRGACNDYC